MLPVSWRDGDLMVRKSGKFLNKFNKNSFEGIDLDWEYPAQRGGDVSNDKENFVLLLAELRRVLQPEKIIAVAVGATEKSASISYDIAKFVEHVDFVNLMAYDMHGSWEPLTGLIQFI